MLLLSAFFSGMEIAFTSKNRLKLEIDRKQSRLFNFIADIFARHPGQYITTILVGNNIALVIYSLYMSLLLRSLAAAVGWTEIARGGSVVLETAVSTIIIIFVAEFLPKSVSGTARIFITACLLLRSISFICCFFRSPS